jgi:hypothetical protein
MNSKGVPFFCELSTHKIASVDPKTMAMHGNNEGVGKVCAKNALLRSFEPNQLSG